MDCSPPGSESMTFSWQEYWGGFPLPSPGDLPNSGNEPRSPEFQADYHLSQQKNREAWHPAVHGATELDVTEQLSSNNFAYKLNKQTIHSLEVLLSNFEPVCCSMSSSNCCFLTCTQVSQEAGKVLWYSHLLKNFPQLWKIVSIISSNIV